MGPASYCAGPIFYFMPLAPMPPCRRSHAEGSDVRELITAATPTTNIAVSTKTAIASNTCKHLPHRYEYNLSAKR